MRKINSILCHLLEILKLILELKGKMLSTKATTITLIMEVNL
jgi:hypothetical protein